MYMFRLFYLVIGVVLCVRQPFVHADVVGIDVSSAVSKDAFECLKQPGGQGPIEFVIARVYRSTGSVDPVGAGTISAARSAGIKYVDGYIFPCFPCGDGASQVKTTKESLDAAGAEFGMLWYDIERYKWSSNKSENQEFIKAMIDEGLNLGIRAGIYAGYYSWDEIVGLDWTYPSDKGLPLWYAHYDNDKSFDDFKAYGGWTKPNMKQYIGDHTSCGVDVDYDWYPSASSWFRNATLA